MFQAMALAGYELQIHGQVQSSDRVLPAIGLEPGEPFHAHFEEFEISRARAYRQPNEAPVAPSDVQRPSAPPLTGKLQSRSQLHVVVPTHGMPNPFAGLLVDYAGPPLQR